MSLPFIVDGEYIIALKYPLNAQVAMVDGFGGDSKHCQYGVVTKGVVVIGSIPINDVNSLPSRYNTQTQLSLILDDLEKNIELSTAALTRLYIATGYNEVAVLTPTAVYIVGETVSVVDTYVPKIPFSPVLKLMNTYNAYKDFYNDKSKAGREAMKACYGNLCFYECCLKEGKYIHV